MCMSSVKLQKKDERMGGGFSVAILLRLSRVF
jgi:hypothetical protein